MLLKKKLVCAKCNAVNKVYIGRSCGYADSNGKFYCTGAKCQCGHVLNSERLPDSKVLMKHY